MKKEKIVRGYKFIHRNMKSDFGNHKWTVGQWYHENKISLCGCGFHASPNPHESLHYAYGDRWFLVEAKGEMDKRDSKFVATDMRLVKEIPSHKVKVRFAFDMYKRMLPRLDKIDTRFVWGVDTERLKSLKNDLKQILKYEEILYGKKRHGKKTAMDTINKINANAYALRIKVPDYYESKVFTTIVRASNILTEGATNEMSRMMIEYSDCFVNDEAAYNRAMKRLNRIVYSELRKVK